MAAACQQDGRPPRVPNDPLQTFEPPPPKVRMGWKAGFDPTADTGRSASRPALRSGTLSGASNWTFSGRQTCAVLGTPVQGLGVGFSLVLRR